MKKLILISALLLAGSNLMAQGFLKKLKQKAEEAASKTIDNAIEGKARKNTQAGTTAQPSAKAESGPGAANTTLTSTTTYDFVPGAKVYFQTILPRMHWVSFP